MTWSCRLGCLLVMSIFLGAGLRAAPNLTVCLPSDSTCQPGSSVELDFTSPPGAALSYSLPPSTASRWCSGAVPASTCNPQTVILCNSGSSTSYSVTQSSGSSWLTVSPKNGSIGTSSTCPPTGGVSLVFTVNPTGLKTGPPTATVTISGGGSTAPVTVVLTIQGAVIGGVPLNLSFSVSAGQLSQPQPFNPVAVGAAALLVNVNVTQSW